jgi:type I restriction enzyme, R subunit
MNKKQLSERDICTKFITPSLRQAGWDEITQLREEVSFTKGRIVVRGKVVTRGKAKRADLSATFEPSSREFLDATYRSVRGMSSALTQRVQVTC